MISRAPSVCVEPQYLFRNLFPNPLNPRSEWVVNDRPVGTELPDLQTKD